MSRIFFFLLGFGLTVVGFTYMILYMNLFSLGYTMEEYLVFILKQPECLFSIIGLFLITFTIFKKGGKSYDIHL